jgi:uncharacterized protein involved in type VI secretion and phage assembly
MLYFGKYRGKVENNVDPMQMGRVQVSVPNVLDDSTTAWAMPCSPYAGSGVGFFAVPPNQANVWVEFEGGDKDKPILAGCFWGTGEVPATPALAGMKVLKTDAITITLSDLPGAGGVKIEAASPAVATPLSIVLDSTGIELKNGSSTLKLSAANVSINNGALQVV